VAKSYVNGAGLDLVDTITEARIEAWLSVDQCIELCDISERTWYRWIRDGAPRWAIRLVMSQRPALDYLGWKDWEIRGGCLYNKQLSYRYHWTPAALMIPLYNIPESDIPWAAAADNLSSIEKARKARKALKTPEIKHIDLTG
jgi:hypothetical protein